MKKVNDGLNMNEKMPMLSKEDKALLFMGDKVLRCICWSAAILFTVRLANDIRHLIISPNSLQFFQFVKLGIKATFLGAYIIGCKNFLGKKTR